MIAAPTSPEQNSGHSHGMTTWTPHRQSTLEQALLRSKKVQQLRLFLIICAAVSLGLLLGHLILNAVVNGGNGVREISGAEIVTMTNPRFNGRDASGDTYIIVAETAQRREGASNIVDLTMPVLTDASGTVIRAPAGTFDQGAGTLELFEDVRILDSGGYAFTTTNARIFVEDKRVMGLEPLSGNGPLGDVKSDSYEILDNGDVIQFSGNVEVMIYGGDPDAERPTFTPPPIEVMNFDPDSFQIDE